MKTKTNKTALMGVLMCAALFSRAAFADNLILAPPILEPEIHFPLLDIAPTEEESAVADTTTKEVAPPETKPTHIGVFSLLHKVTARVQEIRLVVGEDTPIESLMINMRECISAPPEAAPETRAFLEIYENKESEGEGEREGGESVREKEGVSGEVSGEVSERESETKIFTGWMFASSPGIHALEHPVYDIWVLSCITPDGKVYTGE